jgi:hypothetical protein
MVKFHKPTFLSEKLSEDLEMYVSDAMVIPYILLYQHRLIGNKSGVPTGQFL